MNKAIAGIFVFSFLLSTSALAGETDDDSPFKRVKKGLASYEDEDFSVFVHTRLQMWAGWVDSDSLLTNGDRMQKSGFRLRRARLKVDGQFLRDFSYELELDVFDHEKTGGPLYGAFIGYDPTHLFGMRIGVDKFPVVKSDMMSSALMPHLDRPVGAMAISPANAMGVLLYSEPWKDKLRISAGLFNGLRRTGSSLLDGYDGVGISLGNTYDGLAAAGRIDLEPLNPMGKGMADTCKCGKFRLGLGVGGYLNGSDAVSFMDSGTVATSGVSAYLHTKIAGFHLFGEYTREWVTPKSDPTIPTSIVADLSWNVANVSLGYMVLANKLGIAVRGEYIDDNLDLESAGDEYLVAGTINYYILGDYLKAQLECGYREQLHDTKKTNYSAIAGVQLLF